MVYAASSIPAFDVTIVHLLSPQELEPELEGDLRLVDSEGGEAVEVTADFATLSRYRDNLTAWQNNLRQFCQRSGFNYVFIDTSLSLENFVISMLRKRRVLNLMQLYSGYLLRMNFGI